MDNSSISNFLANQQGPSRRTLKRRLEKMCSATESTSNKSSRVDVNNIDCTSETNLTKDIEPLTLNLSSNSSHNVCQQTSNPIQFDNFLNDIEHVGFHVDFSNHQENSSDFNEIASVYIENFDFLFSVFEDSPDFDILQHALRLWSLEYNITNKALSGLLKILKSHNNPDLPTDARTLKCTPRKITTREVDPGRYWHFGIKRFVELMKSKGILLPNELTLNVNIDGLPIYKSSKGVYWPILGKFTELKTLKPFVIGIYFHESVKPKDLHSYLEDFVTEMKFFTVNRFCEIKIYPGLFIMDAPAMAFVKQTIGHNGRKGCGKCEVTGKYLGRMCYTKIHNKARTDEEFRLRSDKQHHINKQTTNRNSNDNHTDVIPKSPLEDIYGVDMVDSFAIDALHVVYLGVVKKILLMNNGKFKFPINELLRSKFSKADHKMISLIMCSAQMSKPSEFNRAIRSLEYVSHYKGSEFRNFLLYHGIVALKGNVSNDIYNNFLTLHCAVTICSSDKHRQYVPTAKKLLEKFVVDFKRIYGRCMTSHNVHQLLHIADYVLQFGSLDNYSAFPFESKLGVLKNFINSGNNPLEQAANRVVEHIEADLYNFMKAEDKSKSFKPIAKARSIQFNDFLLKNNNGDKWFLTKSKDIVSFEKVLFDCKGMPESIVGRKIQTKIDFYDIMGIRSSFLDVYQSNGTLDYNLSYFTLNEIENKVYCIEDLNENRTFFPILNTTLNL